MVALSLSFSMLYITGVPPPLMPPPPPPPPSNQPNVTSANFPWQQPQGKSCIFTEGQKAKYLSRTFWYLTNLLPLTNYL